MELGSVTLKRIGLFCFPIKHSTHTQGKQAQPVFKLKDRVPQGPHPAMGGLQIPRWLGSDPLSAWWLGLAPATLEFWVRFPRGIPEHLGAP